LGLSDALDIPNTLSRPRFDRANRVLRGSRCTGCGGVSWPGRAVCQDCGSASIEAASFGPGGEIASCADVWVPVDGLDSPYVLGQIRIENGPTVFAHIRGTLPGTTVRGPVTLVFSDSDTAVPPFWFEVDPDEDG
jgi:uncharacterized OB-fold protein